VSKALDAAFDLAAARLFAGQGEQTDLFDDAAVLFCRRVETGNLQAIPRELQYTASTLKAGKPELYNLVVWMLLQGMGIRHAARVAQISANTVGAIAKELDRSADVDTVRAALAGNARALARLTLERIEEILLERDRDELDEGKLANLFKHLVEKAELLAGNPTERIEWKPEPREKIDYAKYIEAEAVEMGTGVGNSGPHGTAAAGSDGVHLGLPDASVQVPDVQEEG
jgi:hypothetical protein